MIRVVRRALVGLLLIGVGFAEAAEETPPTGTWKITLPLTSKFGDKPLWLVKLENKDGKWSGQVLGHAEDLPKATLENLTVTKDALRFNLKLPRQTFPFSFRLSGEKTTKLYGVLKRSNLNPAELERTSLTSLDSFDLFKETLATRKDNATAIQSALGLLSMAAEKKAKPEEVRSWATRAVKAAEVYGSRWQRDVILNVVSLLDEQDGYEAIAVTYARQAERLLEEGDRPGVRKRVLDALASALRKAGKADEAKEIEARAKKIDLTIKPAPFAGRRGKSDRVVLVELFTGTQCPPCVAADMAFDALGKAFKPSEVVRLQYHEHIPGPDPLANPDSEARLDYYRVEGTPTVLFNGKPFAGDGGGAAAGWEKYDEYVEELLPLLEEAARAKLTATATRKGTKISIDVAASDVPAEGNYRLRVVLVEEQVAYTGPNKLAEHQHVVRAFAGGVGGEKISGATLRKTFTLDVEEVRKNLREYLVKMEKKNEFPSKDRPLDLKKLRIVAFVQNDDSREVLQVVQADVNE